MLKSYTSQSNLTKAYIQMHISVLLWGLTGPLGKAIGLSPGLLVWYRMIIASVSLFLFVKYTGKSFSITRKQLWKLSSIGALLTIHWLCFYGAIKYSNISITLSLFSSTTLFTALMEPLITGRRFNKLEILYSLMAMAGIAIISYTDKNNYTTGIILAILAAFIGAFFNIFNKKVVSELAGSVVSFYEIFFGLLTLTVLLPFYIMLFKPDKLLPDTSDWVLITVLAIACTHFTLVLSLNALKYLSAFTLNLTINLEPIYGIALAFLFFHENTQLNIWFFVGSALIMASVLMHGYFAPKEKTTVELEVT